MCIPYIAPFYLPAITYCYHKEPILLLMQVSLKHLCVYVYTYSVSQKYTSSVLTESIVNTVEPPSKGHFGANSFVPCREVVPISEGPLSEVPL